MSLIQLQNAAYQESLAADIENDKVRQRKVHLEKVGAYTFVSILRVHGYYNCA